MSNKQVSMADFEELLNAQLQGFRKGFNPGDRVTGIVRDITAQHVVLDVNAKHEGLVPRADMSDKDGSLRCEPGDRVEVIFAGMQGGSFLFSTSFDSKQVVDRALIDAFEHQMPVEGRVEKEVTGGYEVMVGSERGFCPFSQIEIFRKEGEEYIGKTFNFMVSEYGEDERGRNIILSRRALQEREREAQRQELEEDLYEGMIVTGTVTRIMEFGVFVELGGAEGLIPLKEIAWGRNIKPEDVVKPGDSVDVMIMGLEWERNRISLSLRGAQGNPWEDAVTRFPQGATLTGKITQLERFGAFAEIVPGVEGLIPISKLGGGRRIMSAREVVAVGDELLLQVESIDFERKRISLVPVDERVRALQPGKLEIGSRVNGIVESIQNFGVFVRLSEEQTGLLHISECEITKGGNPAAKLERAFPLSSEIEVVVKSLDGERIGLTLPTRWEETRDSENKGDANSWQSEQPGSASFGSLEDAFSGLKF